MTSQNNQMTKFLIALSLSLSVSLNAVQKPNILIIIADDCTFSDLPINGGQNAKTPHLDAFAKQSLIFNRAYLGMAMCSPCRSELYTGRYPHRNGCAWNHGTCRPGTRSMPHILRPQGYRVGLAGKTHVKPKAAFPFEKIPGFDQNCVRNPTQPHDLSGSKEFVTRDPDQPFCLVVALTEPHAPWVMGDASAYPPGKIKLPPYLADTPMTRQQYADYLAEITYMDSQVGELLLLLEETKNSDNTLVLFTSEQGAQFPGCKWTNWDNGLHTSLVARWPKKITSGRTNAIVQYADILPTILDLAGSKPNPKTFDGHSFAGVLLGEDSDHRDYAFGMHNNYPEGPTYPIRSITNGKWRYIRNLSHTSLYIEKHLMGKHEHNPYWSSWVFSSFSNPKHEMLVNRFMKRPAEELYHTNEDHYEMTNLASDPTHAKIKETLATILDQHLKDQGDPGLSLDTKKAHKAAANLTPSFQSRP